MHIRNNYYKPRKTKNDKKHCYIMLLVNMLCAFCSAVNFSEEALFVALKNREACNPVLRTQAESLILLFMENQ